MVDDTTAQRRQFLKTVGTTGLGVLSVGAISGVASADSRTRLDITGVNGGGEYFLTVNDPNAYKGGGGDGEDGVRNYDNFSDIYGAVGGGTDTFFFNGSIGYVQVQGDMNVNPDGGLVGGNIQVGSLVITGYGDYRVNMTGSVRYVNGSKDGGRDSTGNGYTVGQVLGGEDQLEANGEISFIKARNVGSQLTINHDFGRY